MNGSPDALRTRVESVISQHGCRSLSLLQAELRERAQAHKDEASKRSADKSDVIMSNQCYACGNPVMASRQREVFLEDDDYNAVYVGSDCYRHINRAGMAGYKPRRGGPRLFVKKWYAAAYAEKKSA